MIEPHALEFSEERPTAGAGSLRDNRNGNCFRLFPAAKPAAEVVGTFSRFGKDMQSFEVVSLHGHISVRPHTPDMAYALAARQLPVEEHEVMRRAA